MSRTLIISEGIDDVRALRGIYQRVFNFKSWPDGTRRFGGRSQLLRKTSTGAVLELAIGRDRQRAAQATREKLNEAYDDYDRIGLVVDPDRDDDRSLKAWIEAKVTTSFTTTHLEPLGLRVNGAFGPIEFLATAWDTPTTFDHLPTSLRNLERTAVELLKQGHPDRAALVLKLLDVIKADKPSWKTDFRLFNAICKPATEDGFVDHAFGQDEKIRPYLISVLGSTALLGDLAWLAFEPCPEAPAE